MQSRLSFILSVTIASISTPAFSLPSTYVSLSARDKQELLWQKVESSSWDKAPTQEQHLDISFFTRVKSLMSGRKAQNHKSDEHPQRYPHFLHTLGVVAKVSFVSLDHTYSGIFTTGARGLVRLSVAGTLAGEFVPGMALKFFVDGHGSINLDLLRDLTDSGSNRNFFSKNFSNISPTPSGPKNKLLAAVWSFAQPISTSLRHMAAIEAVGRQPIVAKFPHRLTFVPADAVASLIAPDSKQDFRADLGTIPPGIILYYVWATEDNNDPPLHIGDLILESALVASSYGDTTLFFSPEP